MANVVLVGAGPVGLWTAIQIKKRRPAWHIVMYERHTTYQRSHVLRLDHWSLLLYGRTSTNERERRFHNDLTGKNLAGIVGTVASSVYLRTNDLEQVLRTYATDLGIQIILQKIDSPQQVMEAHPECAMFIAADGAHSRMREALLGRDAIADYPLQHIVEAKFDVAAPVDRQAPLLAQYRTRRLKHLTFEYVGRPRNGMTPVTIRLFLNKTLYERVPEATFRQPLSAHADGVPEALQQTLRDYLKLRGMDQSCSLPHMNLTKLTLSLYSARTFAMHQGGQGWFLVGDAAMGVPYFKALNCGLIMGSRLAQILCATSWPVRDRIDRKVAIYNIHRPMHVATEFTMARAKNAVLSALQSIRRLQRQ